MAKTIKLEYVQKYKTRWCDENYTLAEREFNIDEIEEYEDWHPDPLEGLEAYDIEYYGPVTEIKLTNGEWIMVTCSVEELEEAIKNA